MPEEKEKKEELSGEFPDELTKKIVEDIKKEKETSQSPEEEKSEESEISLEEETQQPEEGEGSEPSEGEEEISESEPEEGEEEEKKRTPRLVESWKLRVAEKKWQREKKELEDKIRELQEQIQKKSQPEKEEGIKEFAEKYGIDEDFVSDLLKLIKPSISMSEFQEELQALKEEKEWQKQYQEFEKEFVDKLEPLIVKEGIPEDFRPKLKNYIRDLAFTDRFASWPLDDIYLFLKAKGHINDFLPKEKKKSAEAGKGGARGKEAESLKEIMENMSPEEFLKWSDEKAKKESRYRFHRA